MAKAKRTSRTEARRRYRADQSVETEEALESTTGSGQEGRSGPARSRTTSGRPSLMEGLRLAYNKPDWRADLRILPAILLSRAVLIPSALVVVSGILLLTTLYEDTLVRLFVGAFVLVPPLYPPALIGPFVGGFLATRASYIVGGAIGTVVVIMFGVFVFVTPADYDTGQRVLAVGQSLYMIPISAVFASLAAYYRRLLRIISPPPGQRSGARSGRPSR